jgi:hypothetical protein
MWLYWTHRSTTNWTKKIFVPIQNGNDRNEHVVQSDTSSHSDFQTSFSPDKSNVTWKKWTIFKHSVGGSMKKRQVDLTLLLIDNSEILYPFHGNNAKNKIAMYQLKKTQLDFRLVVRCEQTGRFIDTNTFCRSNELLEGNGSADWSRCNENRFPSF